MSEESTKADATTSVVPIEENKLDRAAVIVSRYAAAAGGAGLIPAPLLDMTAISLIQTKMVHSLSKLYGVPFRANWVKATIASLVGSVAAEGIGRIGLRSVLKMVPGVGHLAGALAVPGVAWATTSAMGHIFTQHFETGGTLLDLNLRVWKPIYRDEVKAATSQA